MSKEFSQMKFRSQGPNLQILTLYLLSHDAFFIAVRKVYLTKMLSKDQRGRH
jgi:hypothetical protein